MIEKIFHVKRLKNPDFSDLKFAGKNLLYHYISLSEDHPLEFFIGQVKKSFKDNYMEGFKLRDANLWPSKLEKQTIFETNYSGYKTFYEMPLDYEKPNKDFFYEFQEEVSIDELRDIANGKETRFIIEEIE